MDIINRLHEQKNKIQVYGQLIHNRTVLEDLEVRGIGSLDSLEGLRSDETLVIRTHGIPRHVEAQLRRKGSRYVDATCPLVKKLQKTVEQLDSLETQVVVVGDESHPEIRAAKSFCADAVVINSEAEADGLEARESITVAAQTTLNSDFFQRIIAILGGKAEQLHVRNTICNATKVRQEAIRKLAPNVDAVVVVGGKNSSNTKKLHAIAAEKNKNTFHIETSGDLKDPGLLNRFIDFQSVGITAGASTPPEEISRVEDFLRNFNPNTHKEINHGRTERNAGNDRP